MGMLRVISPQGDNTVLWDQQRAETGDIEALEALREAERIFEEHKGRGATAFRVKPGSSAELLERFDPEADQIVIVPRVQGG